jgi:hypothetical protein
VFEPIPKPVKFRPRLPSRDRSLISSSLAAKLDRLISNELLLEQSSSSNTKFDGNFSATILAHWEIKEAVPEATFATPDVLLALISFDGELEADDVEEANDDFNPLKRFVILLAADLMVE